MSLSPMPSSTPSTEATSVVELEGVVEKLQPSPTSYASPFSAPPSIPQPYNPASALGDIPAIAYALELFLSSKMVESEKFLLDCDPTMERLYFATGYGLIQCVKGLMSYEDPDLIAAIAHTKHGNAIASLHRKKTAGVGARLASFVIPLLSSSHTDQVKAMTATERHAELVYAESLFEKALLGIVYSGDWLAFIKEALNMRTTISIYRKLYDYIEHVDAEYTVSHPPSPASSPSDTYTTSTGTTVTQDPSIDRHFRTGVYLGVGMSNIILSLMPARLASIVELFGYKGDRKWGLELLMRAGGWGTDGQEPNISAGDEGVRRTICDMALMIFHLVLSSFTFECVDVGVARRILEWNLKRYPNGVFFLFGAGRLSLIRSQPLQAINYYTKATEVQSQYRNLHHISSWEIAIARLALWDVQEALEYWRSLCKEATWSKSTYTYGTAVCLLQLSMDASQPEEKRREMKKEAIALMEKVPGLRQRIAGKSIPLEKFIARKARKFQQQGHRLLLPALELSYVFLGIAHAPRKVITDKILVEVRRVLGEMEGRYAYEDTTVAGGKAKGAEGEPKKRRSVSEYEGGTAEFWDDYCLAKFLEGVCLRYVAYPDPDAALDPAEVPSIPKEEAEKAATQAFETVFENGMKIELDHYLVYHAHYELGRLLTCQGDVHGARKHLDLVLSGKTLTLRKYHTHLFFRVLQGKYSMENALNIRAHAALEALNAQSTRL
ncbi:hypothetical protein PC9H_007018 [Pleurotus ostreatus]|uniref:Uncharacterized protein n=1 Tax=Pleurotus ostreatus TaxID=5322 RepID=A0A8H7DR22_PLEOS|nr:uncharacterized protein PC9H_007018 [Pleurotus ostreatus]KAF7427802.1 hypothetical protein PC9H_007018 [Pleurotus ostreatus]